MTYKQILKSKRVSSSSNNKIAYILLKNKKLYKKHCGIFLYRKQAVTKYNHAKF